MPFEPSILDNIDGDLRVLEIDEIKRRLEPLMIGYGIESPIFSAGAFLYRARKVGPTFSKSTGITYKDLIYPPKHLTALGRLNRTGEPIFCSSMHRESVFFELPDLKAGDELILTFWKDDQADVRQQHRLYRIRLPAARRKAYRSDMGVAQGSGKHGINNESADAAA
jgi:hypothetical protein